MRRVRQDRQAQPAPPALAGPPDLPDPLARPARAGPPVLRARKVLRVMTGLMVLTVPTALSQVLQVPRGLVGHLLIRRLRSD